VLLIECGGAHRPECRYVVEVLLGEFLGVPHDIREHPDGSGEFVISRGDDDGRRLRIADVLFSGHAVLDAQAAMPQEPVEWCSRALFEGATLLGDLPLLYSRRLTEGGYLAVREGEIRIGLDIFASAFFMLTRLEECGRKERDGHDRFPDGENLSVRAGFSQRPVVDEYAEVLRWALTRLWPRLELRGHDFRIAPTHDIDWPFYSRGRLVESLRDAGGDLIRRRGRHLAAARIRSCLAVRRRGREADPCNTFDFLMRESERRNLQSSFYFMAGGSHRTYDAAERLDDPWIRSVIREIDERGHEIGFHPSYATPRDAARFTAELGRLRSALEMEGLRQSIRGGRQHYLRWRNPDTWMLWDGAGLEYDGTLGFTESWGFRCGTCREFPVFNLAELRRLQLRERPLIAMETTLLGHQRLTSADAADEMRRARDVCRLVGGTFTFLWHNNRLETHDEREAYVDILD
jgi:hypothetical protein